MKLELKAIKYAAFASQETSCFEAKIYKDGKPWAHISNDGHGGPDRVMPIDRPMNDPGFREEVKEIDAFLPTTHEGEVFEAQNAGEVTQIPFDLEMWVAARLEDHLTRKDMKAALRKKALFVRKGEPGVWQMSYRGGKKPDDALYAEVEKKNPGAKILNTMPEDDALAIWKRAA